MFYENDTSPSEYQVRRVNQDGNNREKVIEYYDPNLQLKDSNSDTYLVNTYGLKKRVGKDFKAYLTISKSDCVQLGYDNKQATDIFGTEICYLGKEDIAVGEKTYNDAYKFKKIIGGLDGVKYLTYLDENFVLISEEYVSGYTAEYKMVRLDSAFIK